MQMRLSVLMLASALALGTSSRGAAQGIYYLQAPTATAALVSGPAYIARVVDARAQRTSIGWVMARGSPLHKPAMFREGLLATIRPFLAHYAPGQPGAVPLVMRLTGLEIAERTDNFSEAALAGLTADFYAPQPDSSYRLVAHFAQVQEHSLSSFLGDVTGPEVYLAVTPTAETPTYLECRPAEASPLRQVKDAEGAAAITRLVK
jgi:hypothetical protein